ncbi:protein of unknown function [Paraburkholderia dioscoreae]|uniref:Uncharacterized protein n=1 Tax=Paraburkholderia dioscoreae TaxID=2604047 RepID=A0A5Q4ZH07_9BURK|nr:protein of unknown function [Paraburkholderia dioscoreae]
MLSSLRSVRPGRWLSVRAYAVRNGLCARLYITKIAGFGLAKSLIAPPSGLPSAENAR